MLEKERTQTNGPNIGVSQNHNKRSINADVKHIDRYQRMESHKMVNKRKKSTNAASLCDRRKRSQVFRENKHYCFHITK